VLEGWDLRQVVFIPFYHFTFSYALALTDLLRNWNYPSSLARIALPFWISGSVLLCP